MKRKSFHLYRPGGRKINTPKPVHPVQLRIARGMGLPVNEDFSAREVYHLIKWETQRRWALERGRRYGLQLDDDLDLSEIETAIAEFVEGILTQKGITVGTVVEMPGYGPCTIYRDLGYAFMLERHRDGVKYRKPRESLALELLTPE